MEILNGLEGIGGMIQTSSNYKRVFSVSIIMNFAYVATYN